MIRPYLALDTDSPERWDTFATQHPAYKAAVADEEGMRVQALIDEVISGWRANRAKRIVAFRTVLKPEDDPVWMSSPPEIGPIEKAPPDVGVFLSMQAEAIKALGIPRSVIEGG